MATSTGPKTKWAKPHDWEHYRNTITALFMCHSLPVVMRVMREEHQFHATPKMYQCQIYQKWGLRKTKPGEAKKEAKERKRRREQSEDAESVASSSRSHGAAPPDTLSVSAASLKSTSPTGPAPWQAQPDDAQLHPVSDETVQSTSTSNDTTYSTHDRLSTHAFIVTDHALDPQALVPAAWKDFLTQGQAPISQAGAAQIAAAPSSVSDSHLCNEPFHSTDGSANVDAASWISTVMLQNQPHLGMPQLSQLQPSTRQSDASVKSCSSGSSASSKKVRSGRKPPSNDETTTPSPALKRARYMAGFNRPLTSPRHLESPTALLLPEKSMFFARHFISSTFSTGIWALAQSADATMFDTECGKLERWYNDFSPAFDFLKEQRVKRAFRLLKRCFANTTAIIEPQDPRVVIYVCQQAIRCMWYDTIGRNLSQTLLKYISGLCQVLFGVQHPLFIMINQLSRMNSFEFAQNIGPFMDCYFDHLEPFLEHSSNAFGHITEMRGLTVSLMEATGMMGIYQAKPVLDKLVRKAEAHGLPSLHLKVETASLLQRNRFFGESLSLLAEVRESEEAKTSPYEYTYACIVLILTLRKMKDRDGAINAGYELMEFLSRPPSSYPGYPDELSMSVRQYMESRQSSLILILGKLERDLHDAGRTDEAEEIQRRLEREVTRECGVEDPNEDPEAAYKAMV